SVAGHALGLVALRPDLQHAELGCRKWPAFAGSRCDVRLWSGYPASPVCQHTGGQCTDAVSEQQPRASGCRGITDRIWFVDGSIGLVTFLTDRALMPNIAATAALVTYSDTGVSLRNQS